jgi:hypothetical protein
VVKRLTLVFAILLAYAPALHAQAIAYVVGGPAWYSGFFGSGSGSVHVAGGLEVLAKNLAGGSAEFGFYDRFVTISLNGVLHVPAGEAPVRPFVTAGYTKMGIGDGEGDPFDEWNVGAGADVGRGRTALRLDVRDHIRPDDRGRVHYWSFRGGIVIRFGS